MGRTRSLSEYDLANPTWVKRGQIPSLDGLRAVSVALVVMAHAFQTQGFPDIPILKMLFLQGIIGVDVFFVISGFLITTLLCREFEDHGQLQLKRFYLRRFLRIVPVYCCLLLVVALWQASGQIQLGTRDWIAAATYTTNFLYRPSWELGHVWSLSIEEHFYLLWPFVLYCTGIRWGRRIGISWLVGCWLIRCTIAFGLTTRFFPADSPWADQSLCALMAETWTFTRMDTITMGSLLALCSRTHQGRVWLNQHTQPNQLWMAFLVLCLSIAMTTSSKYNLCVGYSLHAVCICMLVWGAVQAQGLIRNALNSRLLMTIGYASYSIYLWQQLIVHTRRHGWIHEFPQNILLTMAAAIISFWLIERPMNRLKNWLAA